jgi:hypothetical protein
MLNVNGGVTTKNHIIETTGSGVAHLERNCGDAQSAWAGLHLEPAL